MTVRIVLLGAGGHARVVLDAARTMADVEVVGLLDPNAKGSLDGLPILGTDDLLPSLRDRGVTHAVVSVGSVKPSDLRLQLFERILAAGLATVAIVHRAAVVSPFATVGEGTVVFAGAIVNPGAVIGRNCIVNTGAVIEHDCKVEDHAHISPAAALGGAAFVGRGAHVGIGATVLQGRRVGARALVGGGAVVVSDVPEGATVVGIPARPRA